MMALGIGSSTCFRIASSGVDINGAVSSLLGISEKLERYEVKNSHILWCFIKVLMLPYHILNFLPFIYEVFDGR